MLCGRNTYNIINNISRSRINKNKNNTELLILERINSNYDTFTNIYTYFFFQYTKS